MEKTLHSVKLNSLQLIDAEIDFSKQRKIFDITKLDYLPDIIQAHIQKFEAFNLLESSQPGDIIL